MDKRLEIFDRIRYPVRFYFTRHGESTGNAQKQIQGHSDMDLTEKGREQADRTGRWLAGKGITRIFASPLSRARETAERIADQIGLDRKSIVFLDDLREIDTGVFSGMVFDKIKTLEPELWKAFRWKSWEAVPGAERISALVARSLGHWERVVDAANADGLRDGKPVPSLTVTHGGFLQWLIRTSFSAEWSAWMPLISTANCGISEFHAEPVTEAPDGASAHFYAEWLKINFTDFD